VGEFLLVGRVLRWSDTFEAFGGGDKREWGPR
jgi:hypothetical protein